MDKNDRDYTNGEITVHWRPAECIHATICYTRLRNVFDPARRPWVNMEGDTTEKIIEIVKQCPTKALTFNWNNQNKDENEEAEKKPELNESPATKIQLIDDGPMIVTGDFEIVNSEGETLGKSDITTLCRCGHSKNMPYCDGTHNDL